MNGPDPRILGQRAEMMLRELGAISAEPRRLIRQFLTPEHRRAADLVTKWMRGAGMAVEEDALGTVRGRRGDGRRLLIGSHIDTVINAGLYDGPLGVVAGILAVEHIVGAGTPPRFGIDVLAFGDEEGSRFPTTLASSSACAGVFDADTLAMADPHGTTLDQALRTYGKDPAAIPAAAYRRDEVLGYVEVHIEQGPVLETRNQPLGVVSAIIGQTYLTVEIFGEAGHAGTVPMLMRRDALAGAAELALIAEASARDTKGEVVATAGRINVLPGAANVIPGEVLMMLDVRSASNEARARFIERFKMAARPVADRRQLGLTITSVREVATTPCDPRLQEALSAAVRALGSEPLRLGSGAGHDGQAMAKLCPIGMLFVRCRGGVSHNPMEYASPDDIGLAIAGLIRFIETYQP